MADDIVLTVNGKPYTVKAAPDTPLLYVLRNDLGFNGPHFGCGGEKCGACMVLVGAKPELSCHLPISQIGRSRITTLEGLIEDGRAAPGAAGVHRGTGHPMRLLRQWDDHQYCGAVVEKSAPNRRTGPFCFGRQPVPLRIAPAHPACGKARRAADAGRAGIAMVNTNWQTNAAGGRARPPGVGQARGLLGGSDNLAGRLAGNKSGWNGDCLQRQGGIGHGCADGAGTDRGGGAGCAARTGPDGHGGYRPHAGRGVHGREHDGQLKRLGLAKCGCPGTTHPAGNGCGAAGCPAG